CDLDPRAPWLAALKVVCGLPSPQSTSTAHGLSLTPGSLKLPSPKLWFSPSLENWLGAALTVGATLLMVTLAVYSLTPPSLSWILPLTVRLPLSVVGQLVLLEAPKAP